MKRSTGTPDETFGGSNLFWASSTTKESVRGKVVEWSFKCFSVGNLLFFDVRPIPSTFSQAAFHNPRNSTRRKFWKGLNLVLNL